MSTSPKRLMATLLCLPLLLSAPPGARTATAASESQGDAIGRTPLRLSYSDGEVSFWRPGAQDWAPAQVNTPLAPGDELYTGNRGNLELQVGGRAFVRAWGDTQLGLANQEPDFLQLKVTTGHVSLDLRSVEPGRTVELDTPHAAFTVESAGYYRVDVMPDRTSFITRRAGRATMTPAGGQAVAITPTEEVVVEGLPAPSVRSFVAPQPDAWDSWNYARTDELLESVSARYVPSNVYGVDDLDHHGNWRVVPDYGPVWVPEAVPAGWVPYSTGRWVWDPYYGWTWVDTASWGWAPYHYGRWVFVDGYWAWAPGPLVARPVYAPALVAFFGGPSVTVAVGTPFVSWVALGWGEPLIPWWGPPRFVGQPWWGGWGGPRVVNNVVVNRTTIVNVNNITVYRNVNVRDAVVSVHPDGFGRRPVHEARIPQVDVRRLEPVRGPLRVTPDASSFVASSGRAARPPESALSRSVVATRPPAARSDGRSTEAQRAAPGGTPAAPQIVPAPRGAQASPPRPAFGASQIERPRSPQPPRFETPQRPDATPAGPRDSGRRPEAAPAAPQQPVRGPDSAPAGPRDSGRRPEAAPAAPQQPVRGPQPTPPVEQRQSVEPGLQPPGTGRPQAPTPPPTRVEAGRPPTRPLPGEPANRLFPGRGEGGPQRPGPPATNATNPGQGQGQGRPADDTVRGEPPARPPR